MWVISGIFVALLSGFGNCATSHDVHIIFANKLQTVLDRDDSNLTELCRYQLDLYVHALKLNEPWAIEMFDAGAKTLPRSVFDENLMDFGYFQECLAIDVKNLGVTGEYCLGVMNYTTENISSIYSDEPIQLYYGKCVPNTCSAREMEEAYRKMGTPFQFPEERCQTKAEQAKIGTGAIITITIFAILLFLVIISTTYDVIVRYNYEEQENSLYASFSIYKNIRTFSRADTGPSDISCLHGIRTITAMWVILYNLFMTAHDFPMRNSTNYSNWYKPISGMIILSISLSVDTFLLMSGLLVSYNYMRFTLKDIKFSVITHYLHRYLRLTPALALTMLCHITLVKLVSTGPLWPESIQSKIVQPCEVHWWKLLLYIQNIFLGNHTEICVAQSWYLSLDMQYYILSPLLLLPLARWPKATLTTAGILAILSTTVSFVITWMFELQVYPTGADLENKALYDWYYYYAPHTRATPWLIGFILGYLIFQIRTQTAYWYKSPHCIVISFIWPCSLVVMALCVFGGHHMALKGHGGLESALDIGLLKPLWSIAIAWIIFACVCGRGGFANWFLSLPYFQVMSKLSYSLYLVHTIVVSVHVFQQTLSPDFTLLKIMFDFWGIYALSATFALIVMLLVEYPIAITDNYLFRNRRGYQTF